MSGFARSYQHPAMTNTEMLSYVGPMSGIEKQRQFLLKVAVTPIQCMVCREFATILEAAGITLDEYEVGSNHRYEMTCPHCKTPVTDEMTLVGERFFAGRPA